MTSITLSELAARIDAELDGDPDLVVTGPASLVEAGPGEITFLAQPRYASLLAETRASAVVLGIEVEVDRKDIALLRCKDPNRAFTKVVQAFVPDTAKPAPLVHPTAFVDVTARISPSAYIGPLCSIAAGATIEAGARLHANIAIGTGVVVGANTEIHPGVVIYHNVQVGERCLLHAGTVLGSDGFGFEPTTDGWFKVPQCGTVILEDDVELGANVTIDRARFGATRIGRGVKIDNLVHIAHNVVVGAHALIVAQVGVSGSTEIGSWAILGGQVGVAGHLHVGQGARIAGGSDVFTDVPPGVDFLGSPARPRMETLRAQASARRIPKVIEEARRLRLRLDELDAKAAVTKEGGAS
jgi:UDP-3-O-[3-hydroxymyristoyl] glucosamine N-acyltransferase